VSQPVKLSDALVLDARLAGEVQERSIAGQVEFWAKLGRSVELLLDGRHLLSLCRTSGFIPLADLVDVVDTPRGRQMFADHLAGEPFPHYEAHPTKKGLLVRIEAGGTRTVGRFVNRVFVVEESDARNASGSVRARGVSLSSRSGPSRRKSARSKSSASSAKR